VTSKQPERKQGRIRQIIRVYGQTMKVDSLAIWVALLGALIALGVGLAIGFVTDARNPWNIALWAFTGVLSGLLVFMIIMTRRAERAAFNQLEGKPGAVGAVIDSSRRRGWRNKSTPVAINPKSFDAVYRMVGKPGIVLIGEGSQRVSRLLDDEARKYNRAAPGVKIHKLLVLHDGTGIKLSKLLKTVHKLERQLRRREVTLVANRLDALITSMPIPKGIDPTKVRAPKPR
jgi:hypothetical protein